MCASAFANSLLLWWRGHSWELTLDLTVLGGCIVTQLRRLPLPLDLIAEGGWVNLGTAAPSASSAVSLLLSSITHLHVDQHGHECTDRACIILQPDWSMPSVERRGAK